MYNLAGPNAGLVSGSRLHLAVSAAIKSKNDHDHFYATVPTPRPPEQCRHRRSPASQGPRIRNSYPHDGEFAAGPDRVPAKFGTTAENHVGVRNVCQGDRGYTPWCRAGFCPPGARWEVSLAPAISFSMWRCAAPRLRSRRPSAVREDRRGSRRLREGELFRFRRFRRQTPRFYRVDRLRLLAVSRAPRGNRRSRNCRSGLY